MFTRLHHLSTNTNFARSTRKKSPMLSSTIHYHCQVHTSAGQPITKKRKTRHIFISHPHQTTHHKFSRYSTPKCSLNVALIALVEAQWATKMKTFLGVSVATPFEASPLSTNTSLPSSLICFLPLNEPKPRHTNWNSLTKELYRSVKVIAFSI